MDEPAHRRRDLYWLIGFALALLCGVGGLILLIVEADPSGRAARFAFVGFAGVTAFGGGSFVFYRISFAIFDSRRYRGNMRRAAQQGLVFALVVVVGLALQFNEMLDEIGLLALAGLLLVSELYLHLRT